MPTLALRDGHRLAYSLHGPLGAPWLILGNSLMTTQAIWQGQVAAFADRFRILTYDQRGHGGSDVPEGPLQMERLGADLADLVEALAIVDATYVGLSMGVPTGLSALPRIGGRIRAVVLVDGLAESAPGGAGFWDERIGFAQAQGMPALAEQTAARWVTTDPARQAALQQMIAGVPLAGFAACAAALKSYDLRTVWAGLQMPAMLVAGAGDARILPGMQAMLQANSAAQLAVIPDAGHLPNFEQPGAFNRLLGGFI